MKYYINDLYAFLRELAANNDRDWFRANKNRYDDLRALWLADIGRMIDAMSVWDPALTSLTAKRAAYRIYRDTRFSPDKTPYKTFFSAAMNAPGSQSGFYIQIGPDPHQWAGLFAGIWCPEALLLKKTAPCDSRQYRRMGGDCKCAGDSLEFRDNDIRQP